MSDHYYSDDSKDSPGRYSDDFDSDDDNRSNNANQRLYGQDRLRGGRGRGMPLRGRGRGQRGQGRGARRGRGNSRNSEPADMRNLDNVANRVMSASRNKINELRNKTEEMKLKMRDLEQENRLYKKLQYRQEKAIRVFEDKESDLPNILDKHNNEVRSLKEQNRRLREKHDKSDRYLRDAEDELERVKRKMVKYKKLCDEKELAERDELSKKVTKAELDMEEKDVKIRELTRHIESLKKNHRHELGIEAARQKDIKKQLEEAQERNASLETNVKTKEKALEYSNIYSNPNRNASRTRESSLSPGRGRTRNRSKGSSMTDLTPRDKAKFYAEKKRAELLKQKEIKAEQEKKKRKIWEVEEKERQAREKEEREAREEREREEKEREKEAAAALAPSPPQFNFRSIDRGLEEREEKERRKKEEELRLKREREDREAKEELEKKRNELERRRDQEYSERKQREEREERERKEREERERREREREEQEKRARLEKERLDNDPALLEERKKKDELLRKLQAMDKLGSAGTGSDPVADASLTPASSSPSRRSKESSRMAGGDGYDSAGKRSDPKEYSFTKPINNLHKGKPSHEDVSRQRQQGRKPMTLAAGANQDDGFGYQPSFGPPGATRATGKALGSSSTKPLSIFDNDNDDDDVGAFKVSANSKPAGQKKSGNLLENLFGPQATTNSSTAIKKAEDNKTFFVTSQDPPSPTFDAAPAFNRRGNMNNGNATTTFPWDTKTNTSTAKTNKFVFDTNKDNSSTLFGGGAALIDDDFSSSNGKVLPRRRQQANLSTFSSKPSVIAMDNFDDDMEEVVL